ncbi:G-protein coupled receptor 26-like [Clytia hemisphaerica]|uniref:G-protein coupled receptor 26-like n=1 Tax=Clytia hemisphaerica TaxID=252671 RepID=UPI0034D40F5F
MKLQTSNQIIFAVFLGAIILIGTLANIVVLCVLVKERQLRRNIASIFLINLLIIDLTNLVFVMPFSFVAIVSASWRPPVALQKLNGFMGTSVELASMLALAVISLDRLAAVMKPLAYKARMTICKASQCNIYIWVQSIVFSLVPVFCNWYTFNQRYLACTFYSYSEETGFYIYTAFLISCNFLLSLCVILATYLYIFRVARSHNRRIARAILPVNIFNMNQKSRHESFRQREIRTASKILFVIGAFVICHLPYACLRILELKEQNTDHLESISMTLSVASKWASFSKSSFNPFIYFLQQKRFRKAFSRIFQPSKSSLNSNFSKRSSRMRNTVQPMVIHRSSISTQENVTQQRITVTQFQKK